MAVTQLTVKSRISVRPPVDGIVGSQQTGGDLAFQNAVERDQCRVGASVTRFRDPGWRFRGRMPQEMAYGLCQDVPSYAAIFVRDTGLGAEFSLRRSVSGRANLGSTDGQRPQKEAPKTQTVGPCFLLNC